jgi:hypothetical protein
LKELLPLLVVAVIGVVLLGILARFAGVARFRYRAGKAVLSPAELAFYRRLQRLLEPRALVLAKVRIADVLSVDGKSAGRRAIVALNMIAAKHTDFTVVDPETAKPIACIELDDASHGSAAARKRDAFVNDAFAGAGLRLLRIPLKAIPDDDDLWARVFGEEEEIAMPREAVAVVPLMITTQKTGDKTCECGQRMVKRNGKRGAFWGCSSYPRCRHTLPIG